MLTGRIFLTGGTGSLGQALLRRARAEGWPCDWTVYSRDEVKQGELAKQYPEVTYILGDVRNADWLETRMAGHDIVIHAGAYKFVPTAETNATEAISSNVIGSMNVATAAVRNHIPRVLGISTDKACQPINTYGKTKSLMESIFQQACLWQNDTQFNLIRYGNVLGSRGSVVPLWRQQARDGGQVTMTDDRMTRFWLTLDDAVDLVLRGLEETEPGTIVVPRAPASTMSALAFAIAPRTGIKVIGIRPGEKMHEQLVHSGESMHADMDGDHFRIFPAYTGHRGNLGEGYEYRSDEARQLTVEELRAMLDASGEPRVGGGR